LYLEEFDALFAFPTFTAAINEETITTLVKIILKYMSYA
jgi:hypothetical protein